MREWNFTRERGKTRLSKEGIKIKPKAQVKIVEETPLVKYIIIATVVILVIVLLWFQYVSYLRNKAFKEGLDLYKQAEELRKSNVATHQYRAILNYTMAVDKFVYSKKPNAIFYIALCKYRMGDTDEAVKVMEELAMKVPNDVVYYVLGNWFETKDKERAIYFYNRIVKDFPKSKYLVEAIYKSIILKEDYFQITSELEKFIDKYNEPEYKDIINEARIKLGDLLIQRAHINNDYIGTAIYLYNKVDSEEALRKTIYASLLYIQNKKRELHDINEYFETYKRKYSASENVAEVYKYMVIANYTLKYYTKAIAIGEEALVKYPFYDDLGTIAIYLGYCYRSINKEELAYETFMKASTKCKNRAELLLEAGTSLERMREYGSALFLYNQILIFFYDDPYIRELALRRIQSVTKFVER